MSWALIVIGYLKCAYGSRMVQFFSFFLFISFLRSLLFCPSRIYNVCLKMSILRFHVWYVMNAPFRIEHRWLFSADLYFVMNVCLLQPLVLCYCFHSMPGWYSIKAMVFLVVSSVNTSSLAILLCKNIHSFEWLPYCKDGTVFFSLFGLLHFTLRHTGRSIFYFWCDWLFCVWIALCLFALFQEMSRLILHRWRKK